MKKTLPRKIYMEKDTIENNIYKNQKKSLFNEA